MNIEIITTPNETLYETGFGSFDSCQNILNSIQKIGHDCRISSCESLTELEDVLNRKPDLALLAVKYIPMDNGKNLWLSEYFANQGIAFSGSTRDTLEFDSDKVLAKSHLRNKGVSTADFFTASVGEFLQDQALPLDYPLFIKPIHVANSNGIDNQSYANSFEEFESKVSSLNEIYGQPVLAEEYLAGKEFTAAIIVTKGGELLVAAVEILPPKSAPGHRILSGEVKVKNTEVLKKITDKKISLEVRRMAFEAFVGLGIEGFGRIDIKSNSDGKCFFMEANLVPGMTSGSSYFTEAFRIELDLSFDETISHIIDYCFNKDKKPKHPHSYPIQQTQLALAPT